MEINTVVLLLHAFFIFFGNARFLMGDFRRFMRKFQESIEKVAGTVDG